MTLDYLLTSIIVILLPGTGVLYTLAFGLGRGWRAGILAALGCTLGIVPHIAASIAGLAALLHTSALAFQVVKYLGVVYLLYMVWTVLREGGAMHISGRRASVSSIIIITHGFLLNILNPKLSLFFLAFLPQFVPAETVNPSYHMLKLALVFMLLTFVAFVGYGTFASAARSYVVSKPRVMLWLRRGFAGAFGILALRLALSER